MDLEFEIEIYFFELGYSVPLDIIGYTSANGDRLFSHLAMFWGLLADADIESDRYRFLGPGK